MKLSKYLLLTLVGILLAIGPVFATSLETIPYTPYIREGYYSKGTIDYVSSQTGLYYIAVLPLAEKSTTVTSATFEFVEAEVTLDLYLKETLSVDTYNQYKFWYDTDVISDGLEFNKEYTINVVVVDNFGNSDSVTNTLTFVNENEPIPTDDFPVQSLVLSLQVCGAFVACFGGFMYFDERRKKK